MPPSDAQIERAAFLLWKNAVPVRMGALTREQIWQAMAPAAKRQWCDDAREIARVLLGDP